MIGFRRAALLGALGASALCCSESNSAPAAAGDAAEPQATATFLTDPGEVTIGVEVADDPDERAQGLMNRDSLPEYAGMVFVFPDEAQHSFWMKDTLIPLDMIFLDSERTVVGVVAEAEPLTLDSRSVDAPSLYVVEVNGGFAEDHHIDVGTEVVFEHVPERASR